LFLAAPPIIIDIAVNYYYCDSDSKKPDQPSRAALAPAAPVRSATAAAGGLPGTRSFALDSPPSPCL